MDTMDTTDNRAKSLKLSRYKLVVLTSLGTELVEHSYSIKELIELGDSYSDAQSYKILDTERVYLKSQELYIIVAHCNLPACLKEQAS